MPAVCGLLVYCLLLPPVASKGSTIRRQLAGLLLLCRFTDGNKTGRVARLRSTLVGQAKQQGADEDVQSLRTFDATIGGTNLDVYPEWEAGPSTVDVKERSCLNFALSTTGCE